MIKEKMLTSDYYFSRLSMFMKNSNPMHSQMDLMINLLNQFNNDSELILKLLSLPYLSVSDYVKLYKNIIGNNYSANENYNNPILDEVCSIIGGNRNISYIDNNNTRVYKTLSDYELILYTKLLCLNKSFDGTIGDLLDMYNDNTDVISDYIIITRKYKVYDTTGETTNSNVETLKSMQNEIRIQLNYGDVTNHDYFEKFLQYDDNCKPKINGVDLLYVVSINNKFVLDISKLNRTDVLG